MISFGFGMMCLGYKSCLSLIFRTILKGMIDGKLNVSQKILCMPSSAISYMDVWCFCSKVTLVASLLQMMNRVTLPNHNSIRQKSDASLKRAKTFSRNNILLLRGQYYHPMSSNNKKFIELGGLRPG